MSAAKPMDPVHRQFLYRRGGRMRFTPRQHRRYFHKLNRFVRELDRQATQ